MTFKWWGYVALPKKIIDIRSVRYVLFTGSFYMSLRALKLIHNGRGESALLFGRIVSLSINLHWTTILKYPRQCERWPRRLAYSPVRW